MGRAKLVGLNICFGANGQNKDRMAVVVTQLDDIPDEWRDRCTDNGHKRYRDENNESRYCDTGELVSESPYRPCAKCGEYPNKDGEDSCFKHLGNVVNACCGHGLHEGYVQFDNGITIRGYFKVEYKSV